LNGIYPSASTITFVNNTAAFLPNLTRINISVFFLSLMIDDHCFLQVIHGLDELVYYYQHQPNSGLQHSLTHFVPGEDCPASVKLHGVENLLHRASANGSLTVVSELLKCGGNVDSS